MTAVTDCASAVLVCGLLAAAPALAEKADRQRPIQIEADSVRMDDARKTAVYEGNVVLVQGTLNIRAERIDVRQDERGMVSGDATGRPVQFRQKMEGKSEFIEAQATRIEYDAHTEVLKLIGSAWLKQGQDELRGGLIVYDMRTELYQAQGGGEGASAGRVRAVLRPRNPDEAEQPPRKP
jgi:lipopolysaccharide export system protein LptA